MKKITTFIVILSVAMLLPPATTTLAQGPVECESEYTVQAGDWLSKIAQKYFGDMLAFSNIVEANNAQTDDGYTNIDNPDAIEPGWTLCIPPGGNVAESAGGAAPAELAGSNWLLTSLAGADVLPEPAVTAKFGADGSLSGSSGCNNYSTTYEVDGNKISIGLSAGTMMACPEPIMQQETSYMMALGSAATYQIQGDELMLNDENGTVLATFTAMNPVALQGSSWTVLSYNNGKQAVVSVIIDTELTANFGEDGTLSGSSGCNNYTTSYQVDGETISIGPAAATMMMCAEPEGIMEQEQQYLTALQTAATYTIELDRMDMYTAEGSRVATFKMVEAPAASSESEAGVTGTIVYREKIALPLDAVVKVQLQDVSLADAPATVMGEQVISNPGQVQIPFNVTYDPGVIQENHTYSISVRIEDGTGELLFINTQSYPVITRDNPSENIEIVVDKV